MTEQQDPRLPTQLPDERDRRIEALRSLAQSDEQQSRAAPIPAPTNASLPSPARRSKTTILVAAISALMLIAVVGGLIAHNLAATKPSSGRHAPATVTFAPASDNLTCPRDVAWSPDGTTIAVLGYQMSCASDYPASYSYHPGRIALYDAETGHPSATLLPDPIITAALDLKPPTIATPMPYASPYDRDTSHQAINYSHVLWSPDGKQVAVTFSIRAATGATANGGFETKMLQGVLLSDVSGSRTRVLSRTLARNEVYSGLWNLADGTYIPAMNDHVASGPGYGGWGASAALMPPALRYQWTDDGRLQAVTPLTPGSPPTPQSSGPVGQPDGGKDFTVWQPGVAQIITHDNAEPPQPLKAPVEIWQSSFAAWSANGKFLFAGTGGDEIESWRLAVDGVPAPDDATLRKLGLVSALVLPTRDAGLAAALHTYHNVSSNPGAQNMPVYLSWSPDGKRLAVESQMLREAGDLPRVSDFAVSIYDCASGKLLGKEPLKLGPEVSFDFGTFLRWSHDGTRLLLFSTALGGAQIWGSGDLPR